MIADLTTHAHNAKTIAAEFWELPPHVRVYMGGGKEWERQVSRRAKCVFCGRYGLAWLSELNILFVVIYQEKR